MKNWLCCLSVECVVSNPAKSAEAQTELRKQWPAEKEKDWDSIVVAAADEPALLGLIDTGFIALLKQGVDKGSPLAAAGAEIVKPFAKAANPQWRIGTQYHGGSAEIWYKPTAGSPEQPWLIPLPSGGPAASTVLTLRFREAAPF